MGFWDRITGVITAEMISADLYGTMAAIESTGIEIWDVEWISDIQIRFQLGAREWNAVRKLSNNRAEEVKIIGRKGLLPLLQPLRRRPVLVIGCLLLLLFTLWVPGHIFFVQVEGNSRIPTRQILETAAECGISFGASRREVRSEKMKNALLEQMPGLSWAGVNTNGCTAVISVREREEEERDVETTSVSSIVAVCDGVIRQMTVLRGSAVCSVGQAVKKGQILISGYTDCGICVQAENAAGEIFAETKREMHLISPLVFTVRDVLSEKTEKISLIIGKKRIKFSNSSGISGMSCAKIYEEKYVTLPGGFVLPIAIVKETWLSYETSEESPPDPRDAGCAYARAYLTAHMRSGSIVSAIEVADEAEGVVSLRGIYNCYEMIGTTKIEENMPDVENN